MVAGVAIWPARAQELELPQTLLDDSQALLNLLETNEVPVVVVSDAADRNVEIELFVGEVGLGLPDVERDPGGPQDRIKWA